MGIRKQLTAVVVLMLIAVYPVLGADSDLTGGSFADDGLAARAIGLGGAFTAIADDGNASWWNPAGLGLLDRRKSVSFTYQPQIIPLTTGNSSRMLISYGQGDTEGYGGLGASISYMSLKTGTDFSGDVDAGWTEYVLALSWGMEVGNYLGMVKYRFPKVALGVNVKYFGVSSDLVSEGIEAGASGFGADAAVIIALRSNFSFGVMMKNAFSKISWNGGSDEALPYYLNGGVYYGITPDFLIAAEVKSEENDSGVPRVTAYCGGAEYTIRFAKNDYLKSAGVRAGFSANPNEDSYIVSAGATAGMESFSVDYAYQYFIRSFFANDAHRLGLTAYF